MSNNQPIAQIFCRYITKQLPKHVRRGRGFNRDTHFLAKPYESMDIDLYPHQQVRVGRDAEANEIAIAHPYISRRHFFIYSVEYEADMQPLLYVRDLDSLCGTYVDGPCSGCKKLSSSLGHLLSQGEIIRIPPYWEFHIYLLGTYPTGSVLGQTQKHEAQLGEAGFLIKERLLGNGALAAVHLAINLKSGQQLACKIHRLSGSAHTIRRILEETNILSRVTHPNLLKFVAAFRSSDTLYTFTELATGGDLFSMRLKYQDGLLEMDVKFIIRQIVEAINYLHQHKITHRDLKPENIFFATGPTIPARVIVGDLGFAKVTTSGRMMSVVGTPRYVAPEIDRNQGYGPEVDIWSLGMISLFLVVSNGSDLGCAKSFNQNAIDDKLMAVFSDLYIRHKALTENFMDFIRRCLFVKSSNRMTAEACRDHPWFLSSGPQLKHQLQEITKDWKPSLVVHNSVQDLDLFDGTLCTVSYRDIGENRSEIIDSRHSHYFREGDSTRFGQQQLVPDSLVLKLTESMETQYTI